MLVIVVSELLVVEDTMEGGAVTAVVAVAVTTLAAVMATSSINVSTVFLCIITTREMRCFPNDEVRPMLALALLLLISWAMAMALLVVV